MLSQAVADSQKRDYGVNDGLEDCDLVGGAMNENLDGSWSLEEALAKTSEPRLWDRYRAEKREPTPAMPDLRRSLVAGLLAKIGTELFAAVPKTMKNPDGWAMLSRAALEERIADETTGEIRLFVPLNAPIAAERLNGQGLAEAFQQCVLDDPEITILLERTGMGYQFEGGRCPLGPYVDYHWPLDVTASNFEYRLLRDGLLSFGDEPRASPEVVALAEALADRIGALRALLVSGKIQGYGLSASFIESLVPARLWAHKGLSIDVSSGDLSQRDSKGNFLPLWTGIELRSAIAEVIPRGEPVQEAAAFARRRSSKREDAERIIKENQIDVGLSGRKAAAAEVMKYMKTPPQSADGVKALEAMVGRIWKELNRTS